MIILSIRNQKDIYYYHRKMMNPGDDSRNIIMGVNNVMDGLDMSQLTQVKQKMSI